MHAHAQYTRTLALLTLTHVLLSLLAGYTRLKSRNEANTIDARDDYKL